MVRLLYIVSHPIQYQAPLLRRIAAETDIELRVMFERIDPGHRYFDTGFGRDVKWDIDLTEGYDHVSVSDTDPGEEIANADAIWFHGWQTSLLKKALRRASRADVPVLMRGENCDIAMPDGPGVRGLLKRLYIARIFRQCDLFLAVGSANRAYYLDRGIPADRIVDMPYAVDNNAFGERAAAARERRHAFRESLGIAETRKIILFAGKFQTRKNPDVLARAVAAADWAEEAPALIFVGDGEMREALETLAPDAIFPGFVNQSVLPAYYDLADVFVLPSVREPWGLAVNEAMACGTPVVVSDQVGCAADLVDDATGRVVQAGSVEALTAALAECLGDSARMGEAARVKIAGWGFDQDLAGLRTALRSIGKLP